MGMGTATGWRGTRRSARTGAGFRVVLKGPTDSSAQPGTTEGHSVLSMWCPGDRLAALLKLVQVKGTPYCSGALELKGRMLQHGTTRCDAGHAHSNVLHSVLRARLESKTESNVKPRAGLPSLLPLGVSLQGQNTTLLHPMQHPTWRPGTKRGIF